MDSEIAPRNPDLQEDEMASQPSPHVGLRPDSGDLQPTRWWLASSAFPMIAGTLGPVASAFSICALVRPWRQVLPPGTNVDAAKPIKDPVWLTAVNAVQLAVAIVSNIFLLLNMTKRVRFSVAQPVTILGWYISAICLVALSATAAGPLLDGLGGVPVNQVIWSPAYFYGIWAAILYFLVASLMTITFWGASSGHYSKDFNLTASQRTLMLQTIAVLVYLLIGALIFSTIEDWSYLDGLYWADVTLFTIGFGDFAVTHKLSRILLFPYALLGVISLGLLISSIRSMILERGRRRMGARIEEKSRRRTIRNITKAGKEGIITPLDMGQAQDPTGELERRQTEFELMRKIQSKALFRRRWTAMVISTGSWLTLWFLGAYVFVKCEENYQNWTFLEGVYFCFVSFTTIGYGDVTPISNAGKSFFVFWSLLALPTMTVLISNAEDTVVKLVQDSTLALGNVTILPEDKAIAASTGRLKQVIDFFTPPRKQKRSSSPTTEGMQLAPETHADGHGESEKPEDRSQVPPSQDSPSIGNSVLARRNEKGKGAMYRTASSLADVHDRLTDLPADHDFQLLLLSEIQALTKHIREHHPRRYKFEEWVWYLGLIGEDERDPNSHRKPRLKRQHGRRRHRRKGKSQHGSNGSNANVQEAVEDFKSDAEPTIPPEDDLSKWSWVGKGSPLMGGIEESEWILENLLEKLKYSILSSRGESDLGVEASVMTREQSRSME